MNAGFTRTISGTMIAASTAAIAERLEARPLHPAQEAPRTPPRGSGSCPRPGSHDSQRQASPYGTSRVSPQSQETVIGGLCISIRLYGDPRIAVRGVMCARGRIESVRNRCYVRPRGPNGRRLPNQKWRFSVAQAVVEERQLLKTLRWYDGFALALANPGFLLGSLGYSVLDLGGWGAAMLWGITAFLIVFVDGALLRARGDVPAQVGRLPSLRKRGVAQVHDARRARSRRSATGSAGRSSSRSSASSCGSIAQAAWWPRRALRHERLRRRRDRRRLFHAPGSVHIGLQHLIAIGIILVVWVFNFFGARLAVTFNYLAGPAPHDPALRLHVPAVPQRRLRLGQPDVQAGRSRPRLGRLADSARLDLDHDLVGRRRRHVRDVRPRVQGHRERTRGRRSSRRRSSRSSSTRSCRSAWSAASARRPSRPYDYVGALNQLVGSDATNFFVVVILRELHHLDEHRDGGRKPRALRHLEGRPDDQAARDGSTAGMSQGSP